MDIINNNVKNSIRFLTNINYHFTFRSGQSCKGEKPDYSLQTLAERNNYFS